MLSNAEKSNGNSPKEAEGVATILVAREEHWHCTWSGGTGPWYDPPESVLLLATEGCLGAVESEAWQQGLDISQAHNHPAQSGYWHHQFVAAKCCWSVEKHSTPPFVSSSWESVPFFSMITTDFASLRTWHSFVFQCNVWCEVIVACFSIQRFVADIEKLKASLLIFG